MEKVRHQDLYEVLQVSPRADPLIITKAFRLLAALYHPDNTQTGDGEAFKQVVEAYRVLADPVRRSAYDRENFGSKAPKNGSAPFPDDSSVSAGRRCTDERELRELILSALYDVRRGRPYKPGLSLMILAELFGCTIEDLQFTLWYLRGRRLIDISDDSDIAITVEGVGYLEADGLGTNGRARRGAEETPALPLPRELSVDWLLDGETALNGSRNGQKH